MGAIPFWRPSAPAQTQQLQGPSAEQFPLVVTAQSSGTSPWEYVLVNGRELPGVVEIIVAPALSLNIVFSKAEDKDIQIKKILGLKAPEFVTRCTLMTEQDWKDWQGLRPLLIPVLRADGRGEVRLLSHPLLQVMDITHAFTKDIKVAQIPKEGCPAAFDIYWQHWWPNTGTGAHGKVNRKLKDPTQTQTPTIAVAGSVPVVPLLSGFQRPTPSRNQ